MLVACDLDGTLLRSDRSVSERTVSVLASLRAAGVPFVVVTGRPVRWVDVVLDRIGRHAEVICANGALVLDADGRELASWPLPARTLTDLVPRIRAALPDVVFSVERPDGFVIEPDYPVRGDLAPPRVAPWPLLTNQPALKLLARMSGCSGDLLWERVADVVGDRAVVTNSTSSPLVEISAPGVTKAAALTWLARRHGLGPESVLAFGDMPNDISMLAWAGHAVVVADAHPAAKAVADEVAGSNDEDGVAAVLERLLLATA